MANIRGDQIRVGNDVPSVREEVGYSLWVVQQPKAVGCCPGGLTVTVRRRCAVTPSDMLAVKAASIQNGVWECRDGLFCELRVWRLADVNDLISCDVSAQLISL